MTSVSDRTLRVNLSTIPGADYGPSSLPLRVTFANERTLPLRILAVFEPLPVFFTFHVVKSDGTPLALPGGGKIDFGPDGPGYLELPPGGSHTIEFNIGTWFSRPLDPGPYSVSVTYHNQYGEDCFRGTVASDPIHVEVPPGR